MKNRRYGMIPILATLSLTQIVGFPSHMQVHTNHTSPLDQTWHCGNTNYEMRYSRETDLHGKFATDFAKVFGMIINRRDVDTRMCIDRTEGKITVHSVPPPPQDKFYTHPFSMRIQEKRDINDHKRYLVITNVLLPGQDPSRVRYYEIWEPIEGRDGRWTCNSPYEWNMIPQRMKGENCIFYTTVHEVGHAAMARKYMRNKSIKMWASNHMYNGFVVYDAHSNITKTEEIKSPQAPIPPQRPAYEEIEDNERKYNEEAFQLYQEHSRQYEETKIEYEKDMREYRKWSKLYQEHIDEIYLKFTMSGMAAIKSIYNIDNDVIQTTTSSSGVLTSKFLTAEELIRLEEEIKKEKEKLKKEQDKKQEETVIEEKNNQIGKKPKDILYYIEVNGEAGRSIWVSSLSDEGKIIEIAIARARKLAREQKSKNPYGDAARFIAEKYDEVLKELSSPNMKREIQDAARKIYELRKIEGNALNKLLDNFLDKGMSNEEKEYWNPRVDYWESVRQYLENIQKRWGEEEERRERGRREQRNQIERKRIQDKKREIDDNEKKRIKTEEERQKERWETENAKMKEAHEREIDRRTEENYEKAIKAGNPEEAKRIWQQGADQKRLYRERERQERERQQHRRERRQEEEDWKKKEHQREEERRRSQVSESRYERGIDMSIELCEALDLPTPPCEIKLNESRLAPFDPLNSPWISAEQALEMGTIKKEESPSEGGYRYNINLMGTNYQVELRKKDQIGTISQGKAIKWIFNPSRREWASVDDSKWTESKQITSMLYELSQFLHKELSKKRREKQGELILILGSRDKSTENNTYPILLDISKLAAAVWWSPVDQILAITKKETGERKYKRIEKEENKEMVRLWIRI